MNREIAAKRAYLKTENKKYGTTMVPMPPPYPPQQGVRIIGVWRSKDFLAQFVEEEKTGAHRLSVCRTMVGPDGRWEDGIAWEDMQRIKSQCGLGSHLAVEVFPRDEDVVNVANMRHLFILPPDFMVGWRKAGF